MRFRLTPRTSEFYDLFGKAGGNALACARLVERRFRDHPNSDVTQEQVKAIETEGDTFTRDLITLLNTQYITPFDREDIYLLATEIRDVADFLEEASDLLGLYSVEMPTRHSVEQCGVIVRACEKLAFACENLKGMRARRGNITLPVSVVQTIRPDTVFVPYHWAGRKSINQLTISAQDPISKIPEYKVCAVRVYKAKQEE